MKVTFKTILLNVLICFIIFSCKKDDAGKDKSNPIINFSSPKESNFYSYQDTIFIECKAEDNIELKQFTVCVENIFSQTKILDVSPQVFGKICAIDTLFFIDDSTHTVYKLTSAAVDKTGNQSERVIYLHINNQ